LEGEEDFIDIPLAVVSKVHTPWITVGVIRVSQSDRLRLKRFIQTPAAMHNKKTCSHRPSSHSGIGRRPPLTGWTRQHCWSLGSNRSQGRAVDPDEADTLRVGVVQNLDGVAIENGDDGAGEIGSC
ncbi:MAG TPA: hypothetical protein VK901_19145, partial [Nitrospiraceae bacterium]|nr:hypothetical protein [Nitrospiraceae bacterium]